MKKNRPGVQLSVLCEAADLVRLEAIVYAQTTTLGVRRQPLARTTLKRAACTVNTPWGPVEGVVAYLPSGETRFSPQYESCRQVAAEQGQPLAAVYDAARGAFDPAKWEKTPADE